MSAGISDTHPDAERVQIELLRRATVAQRLSMAFDLSETMLELSRQAIRRANQDAGDQELARLMVKLYYGDRLATLLDVSRKTEEPWAVPVPPGSSAP